MALKPTAAQEMALGEMLRLCREVAAWADVECRRMYGASRWVDYGVLSKKLTDLKRSRLELSGVHSQVLQSVLRSVHICHMKGGWRNALPAPDGFVCRRGSYSADNARGLLVLSKISGKPLHLGGIAANRAPKESKSVRVELKNGKWIAVFACESDTLVFRSKFAAECFECGFLYREGDLVEEVEKDGVKLYRHPDRDCLCPAPDCGIPAGIPC